MRRVGLTALVAGVLLVASCVNVKTVTMGNFCDVARPLMPDTVVVSDWINDNDPRLAEGLIALNTYGERNCEWEF